MEANIMQITDNSNWPDKVKHIANIPKHNPINVVILGIIDLNDNLLI
jgi:hypothetical protein